MKYLLELVVPCFGSQQFQESAATAEDSVSDETQTLMKQRRRRKRVRVAGQPGQVAEWRPSLSVISENKPAITKISEKDEEKKKVRRKSEGNGGGDASSRSGGGHVRFRSDDFGRNAFEPVIPAFSPTPFMF
ncbi:hypothetical protein ISN45_Aa08g018110 [Arabidopsis thaliana x Arabidopsis arenosa]|uniref:Uncharacterized protein n=1 Tax=Arabidopsis thaliana x Arabidopsis arenosa TaxID=1240361 RepID=A0A8T1XJ72_9BRAS|nr:hypothetical protein ISN45_Aa08g018110 [Arabidopsis thaliana x Arabidopsis arenosa]